MADLIQEIDYNIQGYQKKQIFDNKGDLVIVEYYQDFNEETSIYSNLMVKETRVYTRNATTTLVTKREMNIQWFTNSDEVIAVKNTVKYYDAENGYESNKCSRKNLINKASMYLLSQVGLQNGKNFLNTVSLSISTYIDGNIQPLLDLISTSNEPYMSANIKATLNVILNVPYGA
jgi:hypothetical protein